MESNWQDIFVNVDDNVYNTAARCIQVHLGQAINDSPSHMLIQGYA